MCECTYTYTYEKHFTEHMKAFSLYCLPLDKIKEHPAEGWLYYVSKLHFIVQHNMVQKVRISQVACYSNQAVKSVNNVSDSVANHARL